MILILLGHNHEINFHLFVSPSISFIHSFIVYNVHCKLCNYSVQCFISLNLFLSILQFFAAVFNFCLFTYSFILGCIGSLLLRRLLLVAASGGYSSLQCTGFSLRWFLLLKSVGFRVLGLQ